jgi:hypothetical protein
VLEAFVGACPEGHECAHGNGVKDDNRVSNLRWATKSENATDKRVHGSSIGERNASAKLQEAQVLEIRRLHAGGMTSWALSKRFAVNPGTIYRLIKNQTWRHLL